MKIEGKSKDCSSNRSSRRDRDSPGCPLRRGGTELSSGDRLLLLTACAPTHLASQNFFDRLGRSVFLRRRNHLSTFRTGRSHCLAKEISSPWKTTRQQGSGSGPKGGCGHLV